MAGLRLGDAGSSGILVRQGREYIRFEGIVGIGHHLNSGAHNGSRICRDHNQETHSMVMVPSS